MTKVGALAVTIFLYVEILDRITDHEISDEYSTDKSAIIHRDTGTKGEESSPHARDARCLQLC